MWNRFATVLCLSALGLGIGVTPAHASETRVQDFTFVCDGTLRTIVFDATDLGISASRFIQGFQIALSDTSLQSLRLQIAGDPSKTIAVMGVGDVSAREDYTGFFQVKSDASGNVAFELTVSCRSKSSLNGTVVIEFFS